MQTIRIQRLQVRHRLPGNLTQHRRRLDRVLLDVLETELERAVDHLGLDPREEVCIRRVQQTVKLRLSTSDQALAEDWGQSLAEAILRSADATQAGTEANVEVGTDEVVRYPSRAQALLDVADGVACESYERAWAWHQIGLWSATLQPSSAEASDLLVRALGNEPAMTIPVLRFLAERNLLDRIIARLETRHWIALAIGALQATGAIVRAADLTLPTHPKIVTGSEDEAARSSRLAERLSRRSVLARAMAAAEFPPSVRRAFAALVLVEMEPVFATGPREPLLQLLSALERSISVAKTNWPRARGLTQPTVNAELENQNVPALDETRAGQGAETRCRGWTTYGGLLFLISVVGRLGLPARMTGLFPERPLRWALFNLALTLIPARAEDPVALAFAGLSPNEGRPDEDDAPPTTGEREAFVALAGEISAELESLLGSLGLPAGRLMLWVCERRAELVTEPGWIEAHFSLEDVSTDLRRAAFDLDPGHVPWLGVVIKFIYE